MAKRTAQRGKKAKSAKKRAPAKASTRRSAARKPSRRVKTKRATPKRKRAVPKLKRAASKRKPAASKRRTSAGKPAVSRKRAKAPAAPRLASPVRLDRARRTLEETVPTPPSSLDMIRKGSSVRSGRAGFAESLSKHKGMTPELTGGDVDVNWENAYFTGDEAPGGDNPTPDQEVVEEIGRSLGVEYQDNEELKSTDKIADRDRNRWEYDPASSEDYKDRK